MSRFRITTLVFASALALGFDQARASTTFLIGNGGLETFNLTWDGHTENALAGAITLTKVATVPPGTLPSTVSVCTDIGGTVWLGSSYVYSDPTVFNNQDGLVPTWGSGNAGVARDALWSSLTSLQQNDASAAINAAADIFKRHSDVLTGGTLAQKAALQLAVWEALLDTASTSSTTNLGVGRFKVNSGDIDAISLATTYLREVDPTARYTGFLLIPTDRTAQEMLFNVTPVPEPTTIIAGALLLLPLLGASIIRFFRNRLRS